MQNFTFPARVDSDESGFMVSFDDVPGAFGAGDTQDEALLSGEDGLIAMLLDHMERGVDLPLPGEAGPDTVLISVPAEFAAKLGVWQAWRDAGISKSELARRLGKHEAEARRILDPTHRTKLKLLDEALRVLGQRMDISIRAA